MYVNDLPSSLTRSFCTLYADDTCISLANNNFSELFETLNYDLVNLHRWLSTNRLTLNVSKTVAINFSTRPAPLNSNCELKVNSETVQFVKHASYLGVVLDQRLSFAQHIDKLCSKISKNIGIIRRLSSVVPRPILRTLYFSLVNPYLTYCIIIWGNSRAVHIDKLYLLQKRAVRILAGVGFHEHSNPLFTSLNIMKVREMYRFSCCKYVYKHRQHYPNNEILHHTRQAGNIPVNFERLDVTQNSIFFNPPKYFNSLPDHLKSSYLPLNRFVKEAKSSIMN